MLKVEALTRLHIGPVTFDVADGACLAITGPSGAGKSVLLRAIADLDPNTGDARTGSCRRNAVPAPEWRKNVALLPAESGWWADTVAVHFRDSDGQRDMLPDLGLPAEAMNWDVARLSSGERHRLALIRALETNPQVLMLDEPTGALDTAATEQVETLLKSMMARGLSVVVVTHDPGQPGRLGADVVRLDDGQLHHDVDAHSAGTGQ